MLVSALGVLAACEVGPKLGGAAGVLEAPPPVSLTGVVFEGYRMGERDVEVRAAAAEIDNAERTARLRAVEIRFKDELRGDVEVRADRALLELDSDDFVLRGNVRGTTREGERFETAEVYYEQAGHRLWTDEPVRIFRGGLVLDGKGMEMDVSARRITLTGGVRMRSEGG